MWFDALSELKRKSKKTLKQISDESGVPLGTLNKLFAGQTKDPKLDTVRAVVHALGYTLDDLDEGRVKLKNASSLSDEALQLAKDYDDKLDTWGKIQVRSVADNEIARCKADRQARDAALFRNSRQEMEVATEIEPEDQRAIDLMFDEEKTAAGSGYQLIEERMQVWKVLYNDLTRKADFCIEVDGQSMEPMIEDGDIILIRQQPSVDVGEIGLFTVNDKGYVKKQGTDRLISINKKFEDIIPGEFDTVFCRGKVIGVLDPEWIIEQ